MTSSPRYTKKPKRAWSSVRLTQDARDLVYRAASREGVSQAEFLRVAVSERAQKVLAEA
jgi:uncharacterized protein (DUF1778 family)